MDEVAELEVVLVVELATELDAVVVLKLAELLMLAELLFEVVAEVVEPEETLVELEVVGPWASST
jgi:hypothetical protein